MPKKDVLLTPREEITIDRLHAEGHALGTVARLSGCRVFEVRKYLESQGKQCQPYNPEPPQLAEREILWRRLEMHRNRGERWMARKILRKIRETEQMA